MRPRPPSSALTSIVSLFRVSFTQPSRFPKMSPPLPKHAQLPPGTPVNIVLKLDQRTGKTTAGTVAERLTKGDHPRGVKVRLGDGRVGRVQSLASGAPAAGGVVGKDGGEVGARGEGGLGGVGDRQSGIGSQYSGGERGGAMRGGWVQDDVRNDPVPVEERSLEDYIKAPSRNQRKKGRKGGDAGTFLGLGEEREGPSGQDERLQEEGLRGGSQVWGEQQEKGLQERLEGEFPKLDPALIAAIVTDHGGGDGAREVLKGLT